MVEFKEWDIRGKWDILHERVIDRLIYSSKLNIPHLSQTRSHTNKAVVVGGGPSVIGFLDELKRIRTEESNSFIFPVNAAHDWLIKNDVIPHNQIIFESDLDNAKQALGGESHKDVHYYVCSHCKEEVFNSLKDNYRILWHSWNEPPEYQRTVARLYPGEFMVGWNSFTLFRVIGIAMILGFNRFDLYGCDCSFINPSETHLPGYVVDPTEPEIVVYTGHGFPINDLKPFRTTAVLSHLSGECVRFYETYKGNLSFNIYGDSLLSSIFRIRYPENSMNKELPQEER